MSRTNIPLGDWPRSTDPAILKRMFQYKLAPVYYRPSPLDVLAQQAIVISKRSTCMWYEVGAILFHHDLFLSSGYNGAARGDVNPREAGCARVVEGKLQEGKGLCRGSHAELNAINNLSSGTFSIHPIDMMVTLHPCNGCAKQIVNKGIKRVFYLWEYGREQFVTDYLEKLGVEVIRYSSPFLEDWIKVNHYDPIGLRYNESSESKSL
jgi:dCMP deaminase